MSFAHPPFSPRENPLKTRAHRARIAAAAAAALAKFLAAVTPSPRRYCLSADRRARELGSLRFANAPKRAMKSCTSRFRKGR